MRRNIFRFSDFLLHAHRFPFAWIEDSLRAAGLNIPITTRIDESAQEFSYRILTAAKKIGVKIISFHDHKKQELVLIVEPL